MSFNPVAKHMRTFNKGAGSHTNQVRKNQLQGNLSELLDEYFLDVEEEQGDDLEEGQSLDSQFQKAA